MSPRLRRGSHWADHSSNIRQLDHVITLAIQAMIMRAIAIYESLFSDPITIEILFRYSTTAPAQTAPAPVHLFRQAFSHRAFSSLTTYRGTVSSAL